MIIDKIKYRHYFSTLILNSDFMIILTLVHIYISRLNYHFSLIKQKVTLLRFIKSNPPSGLIQTITTVCHLFTIIAVGFRSLLFLIWSFLCCIISILRSFFLPFFLAVYICTSDNLVLYTNIFFEFASLVQIYLV